MSKYTSFQSTQKFFIFSGRNFSELIYPGAGHKFAAGFSQITGENLAQSL